MLDIIQLIEQYRKQNKLTKEQLCKYCGINKNSYTNYIKGGKVPYHIVTAMLERMDKQILIVDNSSVYINKKIG